MVIVKLIGGLGNQMFQYAAGLQLATLHQTSLKLDTLSFEQYKLRQYELDTFQLKAEFATPQEVAQFTGNDKNPVSWLFFKIGQKLKPAYRRTVLNETHLTSYNLNFSQLPNNVYLNGYWQSEKYFADIKDTIRQEFTVKINPDIFNRQMAEQITQTQSVSIHIRRGDYASNPAINRVHGLCPLDYYQKAVNYIAQTIPNCHFYVFSDDHGWVSKNLKLDYPVTMIDHNNAAKSYEDLRLMTLCKHHIIANSSFSWWGAWLGTNPQKIVIAPEKWLADHSVVKDYTMFINDLIPQSWLKF